MIQRSYEYNSDGYTLIRYQPQEGPLVTLALEEHDHAAHPNIPRIVAEIVVDDQKSTAFCGWPKDWNKVSVGWHNQRVIDCFGQLHMVICHIEKRKVTLKDAFEPSPEADLVTNEIIMDAAVWNLLVDDLQRMQPYCDRSLADLVGFLRKDELTSRDINDLHTTLLGPRQP